MRIIVFDTETTGVPRSGAKLDEQPYVCQFASVSYDLDLSSGEATELEVIDQLIKPEILIPFEATEIHKITNSMVKDAPSFGEVADKIMESFRLADIAVAHNIAFDQQLLEFELLRLGRSKEFLPEQTFDTMKETKDMLQLRGRHGGFKNPRLEELYRHLFNDSFDNAHNALADVKATAKCLKELFKKGVFEPAEPLQDSLF
jgi:DNA polymerase III epsilon subunit-like protein